MISIRPFVTQQVAVHRPSIHLRPQQTGGKRNTITFSTFRIKDFGGMESISLEPEAKLVLEDYLSDQTFCSQVHDNAKVESSGTVKFTGLLFEPVPWSPSTPHGMPQSMEQFYESEKHVIINVPPFFMFKAKIFKPSRLCAIFELI